jgi:hypothetical protein
MTIARLPRLSGRMTLLLLAVLLTAACSRRSSSSSSGVEQATLTGCIYTTDAEGALVEGELFDEACDVYLCGGPLEGEGEPGLRIDDYYFQVTDGTGAVLVSLPGPLNGTLSVSGDEEGPSGVFGGYAGKHEVIDDHAEGGLRVALCPFELNSPDGIYQVWLTPANKYDPDTGTFGFREEHSLTHTFMLSSGAVTLTDVDTIDDGVPFEVRTGDLVPGEARITAVPTPASFSVCELVPGTGTGDSWWYGTLPGFGATPGAPGSACYLGLLEGEEPVTLLFGAACVRKSTGGMSLPDFLTGVGKALLENNDPAWRQLLEAADLVTAAGDPLDLPDGSFFAAFSTYTTFIAAAGSTNEAHLLSREVATALLAAEYAGLDTGPQRVLRPSGASCYGSYTASPAEMLAQAQLLIAADGFTPPGDPNGDAQRCVRHALASVNTNASPTLNGHCCDAVYP